MGHSALSVRAAAAALVILAGQSSGQDLIYGVTSNQTLVTWDPSNPGALLSGVALSGFAPSESVRGIDFRPATGELYALGSFSNLYTINPATGAATLVGPGPFTPALNGSSFGFDFNPTIDRIRVVSDVNQNMVLNPNTGTATQVTPVFYAAGDANEGTDPNVVASAYTNSFFGATTTQLYGIDTGLDILVTQANSAGTLVTVGALGLDLNDTATFEITGVSGIAYGTVQTSDQSRSIFWSVNLVTGESFTIGDIGGGALITAITSVPAPGMGALLASVGMGLALRRRR